MTGPRPWRCAAGLRVAAAWAAALATADGTAQTLTLHYHERPPYAQTAADGSVSGLVATPAARALERAGIAHTWARTPSQRQLVLIQGGSGLHCGLGWFRSPAREALGRFSRPLYRDKAFGALTRQGSPLHDGMALADALAGATLLLKASYSYGPQLDALLAAQRPAPQRTSAENLQMLRMLEAGRADWMLIAPEEAEPLLQAAAPPAPAVRLLRLAGMPPGESRHLYCSLDVPPAWIARIDDALPALPPR